MRTRKYNFSYYYFLENKNVIFSTYAAYVIRHTRYDRSTHTVNVEKCAFSMSSQCFGPINLEMIFIATKKKEKSIASRVVFDFSIEIEAQSIIYEERVSTEKPINQCVKPIVPMVARLHRF